MATKSKSKALKAKATRRDAQEEDWAADQWAMKAEQIIATPAASIADVLVKMDLLDQYIGYREELHSQMSSPDLYRSIESDLRRLAKPALPAVAATKALSAIHDAAFQMEQPLLMIDGLTKVMDMAADDDDIDAYSREAFKTTIDVIQAESGKIRGAFEAVLDALRSTHPCNAAKTEGGAS